MHGSGWVRPVAAGVVVAAALTSCGGGGSSADPSRASTAPSPTATVDPMTVGRLDGLYHVVKKVTVVKNFSDLKVGDTLTRTYEVTPSCTSGPCGGKVVIDAEETKKDVTQTVVYDASTHTYSFKAPSGPVVCTGVDQKKYPLDTTNTFTLTPTRVESSGAGFRVTKFTAEALLKGVPTGAAETKGQCLTSVARWTYQGSAG